MDIRRHLVPGIALAIVLLAVVAVAASRQSNEPEAAPTQTQSATSSPESASTPASEETAPSAEPRTAIVQAPTSTGSAEPNTVALKSAASPAATGTLVVDGTRYALTAPIGVTLKEAMDRLETEGGFSYESRNYSGLGAFVTAINGRTSGSGQYWILYVNGAKSSTGISATRLRQGDVIEWKLEQSY
jgi:hypothetical protein